MLDCNGATLLGSGDDEGVYISNYDNVVIKNCNIQNYEYGIYLTGSATYNNITLNIVSDNTGYGIYLSGTSTNYNNIWNNDFYTTGIGYQYTNDNNYCIDSVGNNYNDGAIGPDCDCLAALDNLRINTNTKFCSDTFNLPNGINIYANDIMLDCNGATLIGSNNGRGIYISNYDNVIVKNCNVQNYEYGIYLTGSATYNNITSNIVSDNEYGIYLDGTSVNYNIIWNNNIYDEIYYEYTNNNYYCYEDIGNNYYNDVKGPDCDCLAAKDDLNVNSNTKFCSDTYNLLAGIEIAANDITLDCNSATLIGPNSDYGIDMNNYDYVVVKNCNIQSFEHGIYFSSGSEYNYLYKNNISLVDMNGIYINNAQNNNISENIIKGSTDYSIYLSGSSANNNYIWNNDFYLTGIGYQYTNDNNYCIDLIGNNYYNGATGPGCDCLAALNNLYVNSDTKFCSVTYNLSDGIEIRTNDITLDCNGAILSGANTDRGIYINGYDNIGINNCNIEKFEYGIYLTSSATYNNITSNTFSDNVEYGIYLYGALTNNNNIWNNDFYLTGIGYQYTNDNNYCIDLIGNNYYDGATGPGCDCLAALDDLRINTNTKFCSNNYNLPNGIGIYESGIMLDCNNATLNGSFSGYGIDLNGYDNLIIQNCNINNYASAFYVGSGSNENLFSNNEMMNNEYGIYFYNSDYNNVTFNLLKENSYDIYFQGTGNNLNNIWNNYFYDPIMYEGDNNYCVNGIGNTFVNFDLKDLILGDCNNTIMYDDDITITSGNYQLPNGIVINADNIQIDCSNSLISGNSAEIGILIENKDSVTINFCKIRNYSKGLYIKSSNNNIIKRNDFFENNIGIYLEETTNNEISYNNIYSNSYNLYNDQPNNVNAQNNYWGFDNSVDIEASIYDNNDDISKGTVYYNPWFSSEINTKVSDAYITINQIEVDDFPTITAYTTVTDQDNNVISNLNENHFTVSEDSVAVTIDVQQTGTYTPVTNVLVMDYSGSMSSDDRTEAEQGAHTFIDKMTSFDETAIIKFGTNVIVIQNFTSDKNLLHLAVNASYSGGTGSTALFDALYTGVELLIDQQGKYNIIAYTDGYNNVGSHTADNVITYANEHNIPIYTIGIGGADKATLQYISNNTGGNYYDAPNSSELENIYDSILNKLRNQYMITFETPNPFEDGSVRTVVIDFDYQGLFDSNSKQYTAPLAEEVCDDNYIDLLIKDVIFRKINESFVNVSVIIYNDGCFNTSSFTLRFMHLNSNKDLIKQNDKFISGINGKSSLEYSIVWDMNEKDYLYVYVDVFEDITELSELNNDAERIYIGWHPIYVEGDIKPSKANYEIEDYLKKNIDLGYITDDRDSAKMEVLIGRHNPLIMWHLAAFDITDCGWNGNSIQCQGKESSCPYASLIQSIDIEGKHYVHIIANEIDGFISGAKHFIEKQDKYLSSEEVYLFDETDETGIKVFDYLHLPINLPYYKKNRNKFKEIVRNALYDWFYADEYFNVTSQNGVELRLKHKAPEYSNLLIEYLNKRGLPAVLSHGMHSDLETWDDFGDKLATGGIDSWLIEMYGGPTTDCSECPVYTFDDLKNDYWPALMAGVQYYSDKNNLSYVGYDLGCTVALESLESFNEIGKINASYLKNGTPINLSAYPIDTFVGVGCIGNFTKSKEYDPPMYPWFVRYLIEHSDIFEYNSTEYNRWNGHLPGHYFKTVLFLNNLESNLAGKLIGWLFGAPIGIISTTASIVIDGIKASTYPVPPFSNKRISMEIYNELLEWINDTSGPKVGKDVYFPNFVIIQGNWETISPEDFFYKELYHRGTDGFVSTEDQLQICKHIDSENKYYISFKNVPHFDTWLRKGLIENQKIKRAVEEYLRTLMFLENEDYTILSNEGNCS